MFIIMAYEFINIQLNFEATRRFMSRNTLVSFSQKLSISSKQFDSYTPVRVRRPCARPASPGWGPGRSTGRTGSPRSWSAAQWLLSPVVAIRSFVVVVTFLTADSWPKASHIIKLIKLNKVAFHVCTTQLGSGPTIFSSAVADKKAAGEPQRGTLKYCGMRNLSWLTTEQLLTTAKRHGGKLSNWDKVNKYQIALRV